MLRPKLLHNITTNYVRSEISGKKRKSFSKSSVLSRNKNCAIAANTDYNCTISYYKYK